MYPSSYSVEQSLGGNPAQLGKRKTTKKYSYANKPKPGNELAQSI